MPLPTLIGSLLLAGTMALSLAACVRSEADPRTGPQLVRIATAVIP